MKFFSPITWAVVYKTNFTIYGKFWWILKSDHSCSFVNIDNYVFKPSGKPMKIRSLFNIFIDSGAVVLAKLEIGKMQLFQNWGNSASSNMANLIFFVEIKFCSLRVRRVPIYSSWLQHGQNMKFIFLGQMAEVGNITNIFALCANYFQVNFEKYLMQHGQNM